MYPMKHTFRVKLVRLTRNIVVTVVLISALSAVFVGDITKTGCGYLFGYQNYVLNAPLLEYLRSFAWLISGGLFLLFAIIILPGLCFYLTKQIQEIVKNSKKLAINQSKFSHNKKDIRMNIGQLIIAIYMITCLLPTNGYFLDGFGIAIYF